MVMLPSAESNEPKAISRETAQPQADALLKNQRILGESPEMKHIDFIIQIAGRTSVPVMIKGESGTGKELIARTIHGLSFGESAPFVKVPKALTESHFEMELFGDVPDLGPGEPRAGFFEKAGGGTLFFEEACDIPPVVQARIVTAIEEKTFEKKGARRRVPLNFRLILATSQNIEDQLRTNKFREDFYYLSNVLSVFLPALRDRQEDIPLIALQFLKTYSQEYGKQARSISEDALQYMLKYSWPGNIDELRHAIKKAVVLSTTDTLTLDLLLLPAMKDSPKIEHDTAEPPGRGLNEAIANLERRMIRDALSRTNGNQRRASHILGVTERVLSYKLKRYGYRPAHG